MKTDKRVGYLQAIRSTNKGQTMMKSLSLFLFLLLFCAGNSLYAKEDGCIAPLEILKPVLDAQDKRIKTRLPARKNLKERSFKETVIYQDGTKVTYFVGGCAHYAYGFTFENIPLKKEASPSQVMDLASRLLKATPIRRGPEVNAQKLIEVLEKSGSGPFVNGTRHLPCGTDANCLLDISRPGQMTISYDFPL